MAPAQGVRRAAVLILLAVEGDRVWVPLMRRVHFDADVHSGQISLPGGGCEVGETDENAALREAEEELGIPARSVRVLGRLTPQFIPVSGYEVQPVVAWAPGRCALVPEPGEVDEAFWLDFDALTLDDVVSRERIRKGKILETPGWDLSQGFLWGATAMILAELLAIAARAER